MKRILGLLALLSACSSTPTPVVGIVTPTERYIGYDPSAVDGGLVAPVGFRVFSATGSQAWDKTGTGNSAWSLVPTPVSNYFSPTPGTVPGATVAYSLSIDETQAANTDMGVIVPAVAGYYFVTTRYAAEVIAVTGTASSTAPAVSWGTIGPTYTDGASSGSALSVAQINLGAHEYGGQNVAGANAPSVAGAAIHVKMITAVTGATALTVYHTLIGYWMPG